MNILKINKSFIVLICLLFFQFSRSQTKNAAPCLSDLTINQDVLSGDTDVQDAENTITATNVIFNDGNAAYDAGSSVTMTVGFNAKTGSEFRAFIEGCVPQPTTCTEVFNPINGAEGVSITASLTWTAVDNATGYKILISTDTDGIDIIVDSDLGNETTYIPTLNWDENTTYYVTITAYNDLGDSVDCTQTSFTTETVTLPICTAVNSPIDGAEGVSITSSLTWAAVDNATGYKILISTDTEGIDIIVDSDLGNETTYIPTLNWDENTTYYVTITAYNDLGDSVDCTQTSFTTVIPNNIPGCVTVSSPLDGAEELPVNVTLSWQPIETATGYKISIGTSSEGTDIENNSDIENVTTYTSSWVEETTYYVTVTPYNTFGDAFSCQETSFTIRGALFIPNAFTPDNDGLNDTFNIANVDLIYPNYEILIYDRWGNIVYKGKNGWNGVAENYRSIGSKKVIQGVYYVLISLGNEEIIKKTLTVAY